MVGAHTLILNHERVLAAFGYWPSFHDARVIEYRRGDDEVEFVLHAFEMTPEVDERGYFRLTKHHRIHFRFTDISDADLDRFWEMNGNTLDRFVLADTAEEGNSFTVMLDSVLSGEFCGSFRACRGEVLAVIPCCSDGRLESDGT